MNQLSTEVISTVNTLENWAKMLVITNVEQRTSAIETVKTVKSRRAQVVEFFQDSKEKAHAAWKAIVGNEKSFTDRLDSIETAVKRAVITFDQEQEVLRVKEQRRLQAEADAAAQKERERLEREAAKLKTPALKQERMAMAACITAPTIQVAPPALRVEGASVRKIWKAKVVNPLIVPRSFLSINEKALDAFAKATQGQSPVDGVEFYQESNLAIVK